MKSKEELIKQVVILGIILLIVIIVAVVLNVGKGKKEIPEITVRNSQQKQDNSKDNNNNEMMENIKGLLEPTTKNEFEDSGTIKQPLETGVKTEIKTQNNEVIQYEEIWNGDN